MKLIINADDFGLSEGITYGIYDAIKRGVVTSTTMMVNMRASALAGEIVKRDDSLSVGLHLNLSLGKPLTDCFSLTCEGMFVKPKNCDIHDQFTDEDLDKELDAQYEKFCELTDKEPTHIDSHLYMHQIYDNVRFAALRLADKHGIPVREYETKYFKAIGYDGCFKVKEAENERDLEKKFYKIVEGHLQSDEILEVLAHPGFIDDYALNCSSYNLQRIIEHKALTGSNIKKFLSDNNIELINYNHSKFYFQR